MKLKNLILEGKTFLAPLAGITNLPFRLLVKERGCAVVCSEMISAKGIFYNSEKTLGLLASKKEEQPLSVQIFGADPDSMARGAEFIQGFEVAAIIDINFGCSVKKVVKQGAGVALMKEPEIAKNLLKAVRKATDLPLTIKIRSGWDPSGKEAFHIAEMAQELGVDAIAFHPRTAQQGFRGHSDWTLITEMKQRISIPVIGNGDIHCVEDADRMIQMTGCDAVMVGRAAMANPRLLSQIDEFLLTGTFQTPTSDDIFNDMERLILTYVAYFGEQPACRMLRGRLSWFVRGWPGSSLFRHRLSSITSMAHALELVRNFQAGLE